MQEEKTLPETLPEEGGQAGGDTEVAEIKDVLGQVLNKTFNSDEEALKSVQDTFAYVGKRKQDAVSEAMATLQTKGKIDSSNFVTKEELEQVTFYAKHPEYEPYKNIINRLRDDGKSLDEVVKLDDFKGLYEKAAEYEKQEASKSILKTNPRLGQITNKMGDAKKDVSEASKAAMSGDLATSEQMYSNAKANAVDAVIEAFDMK